jgi:Ca2+-binding EF-hand superfamily protein
MPSPASEANPSEPAATQRPERGAGGFAARTLASLLSTQETGRPSGEDIAAQLIGKADSDGDGVLSSEEISTALSGAGRDMTSSALASAISGLDADSDGKLGLAELGAAIDKRLTQLMAAPPKPPSAEDVAAKLISKVDGDSDGALSLNEISTALSSSGASDGSTEASATDALAQSVNRLDTNGDGVLSVEELTSAIQQSFAQMVSSAYKTAQNQPETALSSTDAALAA